MTDGVDAVERAVVEASNVGVDPRCPRVQMRWPTFSVYGGKEGVEDHDLMATVESGSSNGRTDETGSTGEE